MYGYFNCSVLKKCKTVYKTSWHTESHHEVKRFISFCTKNTILRPLLLFQVSWRQNVDLKCEKPLTL